MSRRRFAAFLLATLILLAPARSSAEPPTQKPPRVDRHGDPLPAGAIARLGTVRFRDGKDILALALSPDEKLLAGAGQIWDFATGRRVRVVPAADGALIFSPDGKYLAARGTPAGRLSWSDAATGKVRGQPAGSFTACAFTPDSRFLAAAAEKGPVRFWDAATAREVDAPAEYPRGALALAFSADGKRGAAGGRDRVSLLHAATGEEIARLPVRGDCLAFSPDGKMLACAGSDPHQAEDVLSLWDAANGKELRRLSGSRLGVYFLAFGDGGALLVSGGNDGMAHIWDPATGKERRRIPVDGPYQIPSFALTRDGKTLIASGRCRTVRRWDTRTGEAIPQPREGHEHRVTSVSFSSDGSVLATASFDQTIRLWEPVAGRPLNRFAASFGDCRTVTFAPEGQTLIWHAANRSLRLSDARRGAVVREFARDEVMGPFAIAADGKTLAAVDRNYSVHLWSLPKGKELRQCIPREDRKRTRPRRWKCLAFSADGKRLAAGAALDEEARDFPNAGRQLIWIWDVDTGEELRRFGPASRSSFAAVAGLQFSLDGKTLYSTGNDGVIRVWRVDAGKEVRHFGEHRYGLDCLTLSPDGRLLAAVDRAGAIHLHEAATGGAVRRLEGGAGGIEALAFSPDGRLLASACEDTTALVWDALGLRERETHPLSAEQCKAAWQDLAADDAARAYRAVVLLAGAGEDAATVLREHLKPAEPVEDKRIVRLLGELDSADFAMRQAATDKLEAMAETAESALREALRHKPSLEARRRIEQLLERLAARTLSPEELRLQRALAALEHNDAPSAQRLLEELSKGAPAAWLTREVKMSLQCQARHRANGR